jgi:drug/metabolite transporter (DMT)-like permease
MTIWSHAQGGGPGRRRAALWALWGGLPFISLAYQIAAKRTADILGQVPFGPDWFATVVRTPWAQALLGLEIAGFVGWMAILAEMKLSAAFPLSAASYLLVVAAGWICFHEPVTFMQLVGGSAILVGVWMIGRDDDPPGEGAG